MTVAGSPEEIELGSSHIQKSEILPLEPTGTVKEVKA
jgi:hypothetical protein